MHCTAAALQTEKLTLLCGGGMEEMNQYMIPEMTQALK